MFIALRLIARSSVSLAVSIGYARAGTGRGMVGTSRSPDDDACGCIVRRRYFPSLPFEQILTAAVRGPRIQRGFLDPECWAVAFLSLCHKESFHG